ncbi:MAG: arginine--tRNA ligase [Nitrospirae bacterium]|nr:arginine--tRNA ligase [Nitrospirota bacterium]
MRAALKSLAGQWNLGPDVNVDIEIPKSEAHGDLATTIAMNLARPLKKPPRKIAEELVSEIKKYESPFEKIDIAGAGFINFTFKKEYLYKGLNRLLKEGYEFLKQDIGKGRKIQIEFVSANPTGPLHIGHGRGAAYGNALSNILKAAGYNVQKEYYINDAGMQVRLLGQSVYVRYQQLLGNDIPFPEEGYKGSYIENISEEIIKEVSNKYLDVSFGECSEFFTDYAYKRMLADISKDLQDFGVTFDRWQSEKELYQKTEGGAEESIVQDAIDELRVMGYIYEKDGAIWFRSTDFGDDKDRVIVKKDGEYTYFASDIAYHKDKLDRGFDAIVNIWGADHHGYIPRIRAVLRAFSLPEEKFKVILIQMVTLLRHGSPVSMSKRAGEFITLREVVDEVGADTTKFIFLTRRSEASLDFDIDIAKEQSSENPVFYVQYAFARIASIFRQAEKTDHRAQGTEHRQDVEFSVLKENEETLLIKKLLQYPIIFEGAAYAFEPHRITYYLQELAKLFHSYYNKHRVISDEEALTNARLQLCRAVQIVLQEGLHMLGVSAPERM